MSYLYIIPVSDNIYNITESGNITQHLLQLDKYCPNYSKENNTSTVKSRKIIDFNIKSKV